MGVYIKGKPFPQSCNGCFDSKCLLPLYLENPDEDRHSLCPLVEVKEPHGDLIDVSLLPIYVERYETYNDYCEAFDMIEDAPVVIEAED